MFDDHSYCEECYPLGRGGLHQLSCWCLRDKSDLLDIGLENICLIHHTDSPPEPEIIATLPGFWIVNLTGWY